MFAGRYPELNPISITLSDGLDRALVEALFSLPISATRDEIQDALADAGGRYIPIGVGDIQRGIADDRESMLVHFMAVFNYLDALKGEDRAYGKALVLFYVDEMKYREVAATMGVSLKQARTLVGKGMADLKNHLDLSGGV